MGQILFRVLGTLEVESDGRRVPLGGARQRTILSMLLLSPDRIVSVESLVEAVWPAGAPATARNQVAICVAGLRKLFRVSAGITDLIRTEPPGYLLALRGHELDTVAAERLAEAARDAARAGRTDEANALVERALELWRGPVLDGMTAHRIKVAAGRLDERRLELLEERAELQLQLGRHRTLAGELAALVQEHPLREQPRVQLMLAQYRSGRRAEALELFREGRRLMVEELGIEPGPALQTLQTLILQDSPELSRPDHRAGGIPSAPLPAQLLADVAAFTGRAAELARLDRILEEDDATRPLTVAAITGVAGVGKTALAMHWANRVAVRFPDGQLFADLRGYDEQHDPLGPSGALDRFLRALGVPDSRLPQDLDAQAALYRSVLSGKRVLIVLDNVRSFAQVRPLLPGSGRCCVLVTSRDAVDDVTGDFAVQRVSLPTLSAEEAAVLLSRMAGAQRMAAEPEAAERLGILCDRLPLALRIAAARLVAKPHWSVRSLVDRLEDQRRRLDELSPGCGGVRAGFALSYRYLSPQAAQLYRRLGLLTTPDFASWVGAGLLETDLRQAESLTEQLVDAQLLEVVPGGSGSGTRYRFQDLLRLYAWERAQEEETASDRIGALRRAYGGWLALAEAAHRRLIGGPAPRLGSAPRTELPGDLVSELLKDPMAWFESERSAIVEVISHAAREGRADVAWPLAMYASAFFETRNCLEDWGATAGLAMAAARSAGDLLGEATMLRSLGSLAIYQRRYAEAEERLVPALRLFERVGDEMGHAQALRQLGLCARFRGNLEQAGDYCRRALAVLREKGSVRDTVHVLGVLAQVEAERGNPQRAIELSSEAVVLSRDSGSRRAEAQSTFRLAEALLRADESRQAIVPGWRALALSRSDGDLVGQTHALRALGEAQWRCGKLTEAEQTLREAAELAEQTADRFLLGRLETDLACVAALRGEVVASVDYLELARARFDALGSRTWRARTERLLGALRGGFGGAAVTAEQLTGLLRIPA
ncbi:BTAD domain-containing putative transcriptional regulator [Kitasatospora acidiphila]|uniref:AfsR/SARP family transcriptional regulator n=1 Tax=Kitasatospora acidiphila TaxID=2567942 RepID=UPI003C755D15